MLFVLFQVHKTTSSCALVRYSLAPEHFGPAQRLQMERAWESDTKSGSGEPKDK